MATRKGYICSVALLAILGIVVVGTTEIDGKKAEKSLYENDSPPFGVE